MNPHPVPKMGDTVVLNDYGLNQVFGSTFGMGYMKTLRMKITWVDSESVTGATYVAYPVEVDHEDITMFLIDHRCFNVVSP